MMKSVCCFCAAFLSLVSFSPIQAAEIARPAQGRDVIGVAHVAGKYHFTDGDFLNEGADEVLKLGSRVIKVWFTNMERSYPFNTKWPKFNSLVEMAQSEPFRKLFDKPFTTFILEAYEPSRDEHYYKNGMTPAQVQRESDDAYALAKYLLETYKGTGKTFVIQNWEGDWSLIGAGSNNEPTQQQIDGMVAWLNARQDGVERARREVGTDGVMVAHAAEVNLIKRAMDGKKSMTNDVVPRTHCDLYSSSAYDIQGDAESMTKGLDYLASKAPDSALYGAKNLYVGEFGFPENVVGGAVQQRDKTRTALDAALRWGARYTVYWELFCNEPAKALEGKPTNDDMRGFWLIRPDGSKAPVWDYLQSLMNAPL
jgi:hypothetical protein